MSNDMIKSQSYTSSANSDWSNNTIVSLEWQDYSDISDRAKTYWNYWAALRINTVLKNRNAFPPIRIDIGLKCGNK